MDAEHHDRHAIEWPEHLARERPDTTLGRGSRVGLGVAAAVLAGLMVLSWGDVVPTADQPAGPAPVATR